MTWPIAKLTFYGEAMKRFSQEQRSAAMRERARNRGRRH